MQDQIRGPNLWVVSDEMEDTIVVFYSSGQESRLIASSNARDLRCLNGFLNGSYHIKNFTNDKLLLSKSL